MNTMRDGTSYSTAILTAFTARIIGEVGKDKKKNIINVLRTYTSPEKNDKFCGYGIPKFPGVR